MRRERMAMDDKTLIDLYTKKSIAGLKEENLSEVWEPGDHMYRGEFVSPTRPGAYFASDAEVDAYREALARMDGTVDAPSAPTYVEQLAETIAAQHASEAHAPQASASRDPLVTALSDARQGTSGTSSASGGSSGCDPVVEALIAIVGSTDSSNVRSAKRNDDDDDDKKHRTRDYRDDDDDDDDDRDDD